MAFNRDLSQLANFLEVNSEGTFVNIIPSTSQTNLGIGTNNPTAKLDVLGNARVSGNLFAGNINASSGVITATTFVGNLTGVASNATQLATGRTIAITGDLTYTSGSFNGTGDVTGIGTLANTTVTPGSYGSSTEVATFTVDSKGRLTAAGTASVGTALTVAGDSGSENISLLSEVLTISGGTNLNSSAASNTVTVNLDDNISLVSVVASGVVTATSGFSGNVTGNVTGNINSSGVSTVTSLNATNINASGIVTATSGFVGNLTGTASTTTNIPNLTGDISSVNTTTTLATVNSNVGSFGSQTLIPVVTVNAKGLVTSVTTASVGTALTASGDSGSVDIDLLTETLTISGGTNLTSVGSGNTVTVNLDPNISLTSVVASGVITATSGFSGNLTGEVNSPSFDTNASGVVVTGVATATSGFSGNLTGNVTGNADTASALQTARTIALTGDVVGEVSFNGTSNVSIAATIQPNSVGLGTDTTGDYVRDITGTANQITVTSGTGEGSTPTLSIPNQFTVPQDLTVTRDVQITRNLNVNGNITIGGTTAFINVQRLQVSDPDLVLGVRTDAFGNDASNDTTANHGGIAIASTEGTPLVNLSVAGIETVPATYKKIMWFKSGTFAGLGTDAWLSNYAIGIGSTQFPTGTRLAAGNVQFTENDLAVVRNINSSGIVTASTFVGAFTGTATSTTNIPNLTGAITSNNTTTSLGSFSSSDLATALTDETGTGSAVFATSPTLVTPVLGSATATSINVSGIVTATSGFSGNLTGNINSSGVSTVTSLNATNINASGIVTATSGFVGNLTGLASSATQLQTSRDFSISGDATASSISFNGTANVGLALTLANTTVTPGSYGSSTEVPTFTVDSKGRLTAAGTASVGTALTVAGDSGSENINLLNEILTISGGTNLTSSAASNTVTVNLDPNISLTSVVASGVITATSGFSGNVTGNLTGNINSSGVSTVTSLNATDINTSGIVTATSGFVGNLTGEVNAASFDTNASGVVVTGVTTSSSGFVGNLTGLASSATQLATGRTVAITGDLTYTSGSFNGTGDVTGIGTLATVNSNVGSFGSQTLIPVVTVNAKGLVTAVTTAAVGTALTVTGDSGSENIDLLSESLTISGGTNLTSSAASNTVTVNLDPNISLTSVVASGIITATSGFVGNVTGNLTGNINSSGVSTVTSLNATDINTSGIVTAAQFVTGASGSAIGINTNTISGPETITIDPAAVGDNTGAVRIKGDLFVDGTQFIVNSTTIELADFVVGIASTATTDILADGAGIKIGPDNTLTYDHTNTSLKSSENFNLASGKTYKINGTDVLSNNTLGSGVVNSSLTSVGTLTNLSVGNVNSTGIITATTFVGALTGNVTGNINSSGVSTVTNLNIGGYVSIANTTGAANQVIASTGVGVTWKSFNDLLPQTRTTQTFTATANQTVFSFVYNVNFLDVFVNGVKLSSGEFTASNGTSITLSEGAFANDNVEFVSYNTVGAGTGQVSSLNDLSDVTLSGIATGNLLAYNGSEFVNTSNINVTGIITATSFVGDGSGLTGAGSTVFNNTTTNQEFFPLFTSTTSGTITASGISTSKLKYNPSTGTVTATTFVGALTGTATSTTNIPNLTGAITSVGTATTLGSFSSANLATALTDETGSGSAVFATSPTLVTPVLGNATATSINVSGIVTATSGFVGSLTGIAASATQLVTPRTFQITGDIVGSPISFDGTGNVSLAATIQPNSVGLGTDTTGDYVTNITGTANQITVTSGTGEGSTPTLSIPSQFTAPQDVTVTRDLLVSRNLNVNGNITIGGTSATLFTTELKIFDPDIVLGFRTDGSGNDVSNDNTANHGGVALASTEGTPLVDLFIAGIETAPATYKKIMWFKSGTFSGLGTDAWLINYAVGIGSTQFPTGTRLAAGNVQFTQNDLAVVRNINSSGIVTATTFVGALTGTASSTTNIPNLTGDITSVNAATTLATVNANVGTFGSGGAIPTITVNAKGLITGVTTTAVTSGTTITDDTSTNATRYLPFTSATSGSISAANVSSTKLTFNPSTGALSATDFNSTSDINLKENIRQVESASELVSKLEGVHFSWKETGKETIGVIAQQIEEHLPQLVQTGDTHKTVNYNGLIGVLIEAVKEQGAQIAALQAEIEELKK